MRAAVRGEGEWALTLNHPLVPQEGRLAGGVNLHALRDAPRASVDNIMARRSGLPRFARLLDGWRSKHGRKPRVCYCGGSITAQRSGWRPRVHAWLSHEHRPSQEAGDMTMINTSVGNVGSKVMAFLTDEWMTEHSPDVVFIETVVNDGDSLLEDGEPEAVRRALEGVVRRLRTKLPEVEIVFVYMLLRDDIPAQRRTGTKAWADGCVRGAAAVYHRDAVAIHDAVADHYGCPSISLIKALRGVASGTLDRLFRDDCHHSGAGAALVSCVVGRCLQSMLGSARSQLEPPLPSVPPPLDARLWSGGSALRLAEAQVAFAAGRREAHHTRRDRDPITGKSDEWWLLSPGDVLTLHFSGNAIGVLTHLGPDAGVVEGEIVLENGGTVPVRRNLFDCWCYYYRLGVIILAEGLPPGSHMLRAWLSPSPPDRSVLKRPLPRGGGAVQGELKLWISYYLVMAASWVDSSRAIAAFPSNDASSSASVHTGSGRFGADEKVELVAPPRHEDDSGARPRPSRAQCLEDIDDDSADETT